MAKYSTSLLFALTDLVETSLELTISKYLKHNLEKIENYNEKYRNLDYYNICDDHQVKINNLILEIYDLSENEKFYFFDCPISVYKDAYDWRLKHYLKEFKDSEEIDFLNNELLSLTKNTSKNQKIEFYYDDLDLDLCDNINDDALSNSFFSINDWTIEINYSEFISDPLPFKSSTRMKIEYITSLIDGILNKDDKSGKLKLTNKTSQIGFIFYQLANLGYIEAPKRAGEINYNAFAREIINSFNCDVKQGSLAKYLNPSDEKHQETERNFKTQNFNIPDTNSIS